MDRPVYRAADAAPIQPLGDDEELVAGRRPVEESFVAGRQAHRLLVVPQRRHALEQLVLHATRLRIPIVEVEGGSLTALAGFDGHQGIALVVGLRRMATIDDVLARSLERGEPPFVLVLDSLEDPQNLGTLLRSAEAAGVHGVLFPTRRQAPLTPSAIKASAGAVEHLLLCPVDDLAGALADLHARGLRVAGAEEDAPLTARQTDLRGPLALVVGSEGQGLGPAVRRRCDTFMRIPMRGAIGSLNAAVAGSILLFEAVAQRDPDGAGSPPRTSTEWSPTFAAAARGVPAVPAPREPAGAGAEAGADGGEPANPADTAVPGDIPAETADAAAAGTHPGADEVVAATEASGEGAEPPSDTESPSATPVPSTRKPRAPRTVVAAVADDPAPTRVRRTRSAAVDPAPVDDAMAGPTARTGRTAPTVPADPPSAETPAPTARKARPARAVAKDASGVAAEPSGELAGTATSGPAAADDDDLLPGGPPPDPAVAPPRSSRRRATPRA